MDRTRETSIEAYKANLASGLIPKRRQDIYTLLYERGPLTQNEAVRIYMKDSPTVNARSLGTRFSELVRMGLIKEIGKRADAVSGHLCILYEVTDGLVIPLKKVIAAEIWRGRTRYVREPEWLDSLTIKVDGKQFVLDKRLN